MRYIAFMEYCLEDFGKLLKKVELYEEEEKKFPNKYPKTLFPEHDMGGEAKSFEVFEATPEQMMNEVAFWSPEIKFKFVPITESPMLTKALQKSR